MRSDSFAKLSVQLGSHSGKKQTSGTTQQTPKAMEIKMETTMNLG